MDKRTNEPAMVVKDIRALRDSFEPRLDEMRWKFAWIEIKNSSVIKYQSRTLELGRTAKNRRPVNSVGRAPVC